MTTALIGTTVVGLEGAVVLCLYLNVLNCGMCFGPGGGRGKVFCVCCECVCVL